MKCNNCGTELKDNQKFCPKCGEVINSNTVSDIRNKTNYNKKKAIIISIISVVIAIMITVFIVVANTHNNTETAYDSSDNDIVQTSNDITGVEKEEVNYNYYTYCDYSEDLAWINFSDSSNEYWGCIDKTGKLIFKINEKVLQKLHNSAMDSHIFFMKIVSK